MTKNEMDMARLLRRVILISWASLAFCFAIKLFGGNFFEILSDDQHYKALCEYVDCHFWAKYLIAVCSTMLCQSLYTLAILQEYKFTKWQIIITTISVLLSTLTKYYSNTIGLIFDAWLLIGLPLIFLKTIKRAWEVVVAVLLNFLFQLVSLITKNLAFGFIDNSAFITLIYGIDVYFMCLLYYLYRNYQKEKKSMGMFWTLFMGKPIDKLIAMKENRAKKIAKLQAEVKEIDAEIARRKNSEK